MKVRDYVKKLFAKVLNKGDVFVTTIEMRFSPGWELALLPVSQPGLAIRG